MLRLTILIALLPVLAVTVLGQGCTEYLSNKDPNFGYRLRGNRCEGMYVSKVSAPSLDLISLTLGKIEFRRGATLVVSVPGYGRPVHVQGIATPANTFYRMDADSDQTGVVTGWAVDDVLGPQQIDATRLAVLAWVAEDRSAEFRRFVPARITSAAPATDNTIWLKVRVSVAVASLRWRWSPASESAGNWVCERRDWQTKDKRNSGLSAYEAAEIQLPDLHGKVCLDVAALPDDSNDWVARRFLVQASR